MYWTESTTFASFHTYRGGDGYVASYEADTFRSEADLGPQIDNVLGTLPFNGYRNRQNLGRQECCLPWNSRGKLTLAIREKASQRNQL